MLKAPFKINFYKLFTFLFLCSAVGNLCLATKSKRQCLRNRTNKKLSASKPSDIFTNDAVHRAYNKANSTSTSYSFNSFSRFNDLIREAKKIHRARGHWISYEEGETTWYKCKYCIHKSRWIGNIRDHIAVIHKKPVKNNTAPKCSECGKICHNKKLLKRHMAGIHNIGIKWHQCPFCIHKAKRKDNLKKHIRRAHPTETGAGTSLHETAVV